MGVLLNPFSGQFDFTGSGITQAAADARYLKLDASNGPLTGNLIIDTDHYLNIDGSVVFNEEGNAADFRVESDTNINGLKLVGSSGNFGVGVDPTERLHVVGSAFLVADNSTATKAYRWRTNGGGLDWDIGGKSVVISGFTNPDFSGTQYYYMWLQNDSHVAYLHGEWRWRQGNAGGDQGTEIFNIHANLASGDMVVFNEAGSDYDLRFEGDTDANLFFLDASTDRIGIGNAAPGVKLDVTGEIRASTAGTNAASVVTNAGTQTLTNKRVTQRIVTEASNATPTPNADTTDMHTITAQAAAAAFAVPSGTPTEGQKLIIRIKDNGTARALSFNAIYRFSSDLAAPTTTVISKTMYLGFIYNNTDTKWDNVSQMNNF